MRAINWNLSEGMRNMNGIENYCRFENCIAKIFEEAEYSITRNVRIKNNPGYEIDIVAEKNKNKFCVEVKYSRVTDMAVKRIYKVSELSNMQPILVTAFNIKEKRKMYFQEMYPNLIVIDISNLLFAVQDNVELSNELIALLPYTVDNIVPKEGFIKINSLQHNDYTKSLIEEIKLCEAGKSKFRTYEQLCHKLLENIFSEDLALWKEQSKSNNDLYRFDLLCRIKDQNQKTFWSILERYFNSKYLIFEFKNYKEPITQKEVYTTEKYLYFKALRSVAIIISANGYSENAYWAAKGCLRENGKLIILLKTDDLIEMNEIKNNQEDPSNYLLDRLDEFLLDLEK